MARLLRLPSWDRDERAQPLDWWRCLYSGRNLFLTLSIVAVCLAVARFSSNEDVRKLECLHGGENLTLSRLLYQRLQSELEEKNDEINYLKKRETELQQLYEDEVEKGQKRVEELQSYRESEVKRKDNEIQDLSTICENLKSQLDKNEKEISDLQHVIQVNNEGIRTLNIEFDRERKKLEADIAHCDRKLAAAPHKLQENETFMFKYGWLVSGAACFVFGGITFSVCQYLLKGRKQQF